VSCFPGHSLSECTPVAAIPRYFRGISCCYEGRLSNRAIARQMSRSLLHFDPYLNSTTANLLPLSAFTSRDAQKSTCPAMIFNFHSSLLQSPFKMMFDVVLAFLAGLSEWILLHCCGSICKGGSGTATLANSIVNSDGPDSALKGAFSRSHEIFKCFWRPCHPR
jgi:hypothetical protein